MIWLIVAAITAAIWLTRRELRIYRRENPYITTTPAPTPCDQGTCHRDAVISVTRRGTGEQTRVCPGCYDQGIAWGWWA